LAVGGEHVDLLIGGQWAGPEDLAGAFSGDGAFLEQLDAFLGLEPLLALVVMHPGGEFGVGVL